MATNMTPLKIEPSETQGAIPPIPSAPAIGPQDCPTCVRRRIRCDRALPTCVKCYKKGLTCPGYGPRLRWANGIAVRGHLKGRTTPNIENPSKSSAFIKDSTSPRSIKSAESDSLTRTPSITDPLEKLFPDLPDAAARCRLLHHYDRNIAGLMVWIDSEKNEYRRLVLPLAERQPVLLLAILAVSAQHLTGMTKVESHFPALARDAAVNMISTQIGQVTSRLAAGHDLGKEIDTDTAVWMLASMLTLANYEMAESKGGAVAADSHRQAARTLVNALATTHRENNDLFNFLRNQLSIYDILACTTSFDPMSTGDVILPAPDHANLIFSEYLALLHQVTTLSRQVYDQKQAGGAALDKLPISPIEARARFDLARGSTLMAAGSLGLIRDERRRDFMRIVDIYHHAGLLYTYRRVFHDKIQPQEVDASATILFERLNQLEDRSSCMQNLPWPMFIAGTECCRNREAQRFIADLYEQTATDMAFKHYLEVLHFLKDLWAYEGDDWVQLARQYGANGKQILAV
ncbi:hypothetical protein PV11_08467 [Exophiala sideris]|uniref:Zn(2)-C6 fungal-type domain-containing protein n=1 Tax=Exophiala sideris TaxID=1016849 RepID=A0A0D1Z2C3_9EURO|nr:hypothetical protein PV11_08467 [Exophiala sideris]